MINVFPPIIRAVYAVHTLYMLLLLLRWLGPWLEIDLHGRRWFWIPRLTDPLLFKLRQILPHMGPFDVAPLAAVLMVWLLRELVVGMLTAGAGP